MKWIYGKSIGGSPEQFVVVNVVGGPPPAPPEEIVWAVDDSVVVSVGDPFDPADPRVDGIPNEIQLALYTHENRIRVLEGRPELTKAQWRALWKQILSS